MRLVLPLVIWVFEFVDLWIEELATCFGVCDLLIRSRNHECLVLKLIFKFCLFGKTLKDFLFICQFFFRIQVCLSGVFGNFFSLLLCSYCLIETLLLALHIEKTLIIHKWLLFWAADVWHIKPWEISLHAMQLVNSFYGLLSIWNTLVHLKILKVDLRLNISLNLTNHVLRKNWLLSYHCGFKGALTVNALWIDVLMTKETMLSVVVKSLMLWHIVTFFVGVQFLNFHLHDRLAFSVDFWLEFVLASLCELFYLFGLVSFLLIFFTNLDETILGFIVTKLEANRHSISVSWHRPIHPTTTPEAATGSWSLQNWFSILDHVFWVIQLVGQYLRSESVLLHFIF